MNLTADLGPCVGRREIGVMPCRLREVPDRIDHHEGALPTVGAVFAANPAAFEVPMRQLGFEARLDLDIRVGAFFAAFRHGTTSQMSCVSADCQTGPGGTL